MVRMMREFLLKHLHIYRRIRQLQRSKAMRWSMWCVSARLQSVKTAV